MYQNKTRKYRYRSNGRNYQKRINGTEHVGLGPNSFSNGGYRNNFNTQQSADKLAEKYN